VHPRDILTCHRVCKQWHQVFQLDSTWQNLFANHFRSFENPNEARDCKAAYQSEFSRLDSNFKNGVFCLKPYIQVDGDAVSLALASGSSKISIWDSAIGRIKVRVNNDLRPDPAIEIYHLETGELINTFKYRTEKIANFLISGNNLFTPSEDGTLKIWDIKTGECTKTIRAGIPVAGKPAGAVSLAIDQGKLFLGCYDGSIKIYDLKEEEFLKPLKEHKTGVFHLLIRDGKLIAGSWPGITMIWELGKKGKPLADTPSKVLDPHKGYMIAFAFAYGKLFTISLNNTINLWNLETGECVNTIQARQMIQGKHLHSLAFIDNQLFLKDGDNTMVMDFAASDTEIVSEIGRSMMKLEKSPAKYDSALREELFDRFGKMSGRKIDEISDTFSKVIKLMNEGKPYSQAVQEAFTEH
jgi:WD40 repeat protein